MHLRRQRLQVLRRPKLIVQLASVLDPVSVVCITICRTWAIPVLRDRRDPDGGEAGALDVVQVGGDSSPSATAPSLGTRVALSGVSTGGEGVAVSDDPVIGGKLRLRWEHLRGT
jgi:hypothetical protein